MSDTEQALTIVIGYDGSDAARRGLARVSSLGERASKVLVVAVAPDLRSAGLASPLAGATVDTERLSTKPPTCWILRTGWWSNSGR